jgi:hypothetical protein
MHFVMAGLVPAIHVFDRKAFKTLAGTSAAMTSPILLVLSSAAKADDPVHTA